MATEKVEIILEGEFKNKQAIINALKKIDDSIEVVGVQSKKTKKKVDSLGDSLKKLAKLVGLSILAKKIFDIGKASLVAAGNMEQYNIAFTTMLGSAEKAKILLKDIVEFAKKTPFQIEGLVGTTKMLLATGTAQEEVISTLSTLGNIASGVGVPVERLAIVFGQVRATTKLLGQDLNQFTQAGVPLLAELATMLGKTESEIIKMKEAGLISFDMVNQALKNMTSEGGKFFNLMQNQSRTLLGVVSNIQDSFFGVKVAIGNALMPVAKKAALSLLKFFDDLEKKIIANSKKITEFAVSFRKALGLAIGTLATFIKGVSFLISQPLVRWFLATVVAVNLLTKALILAAKTPILFAITAIIQAIGLLVNHFDSLPNIVQVSLLKVAKAFKVLEESIAVIVGAILNQLSFLSKIPGFRWVDEAVDKFGEFRSSAVQDIKNINDKLEELEKRKLGIATPEQPELEQEQLEQQISLGVKEPTEVPKVGVITEEEKETPEQRRLRLAKEANEELLAVQENYLAGRLQNQTEADQIELDNDILKQEKKVFSEEEFIKRKAELDQKLLEDKIEYQEYEIELDELHNDVKTEALEQWYEKQLKGLGDNEQAKLELKIKYEKKKEKLVERRLQNQTEADQIELDNDILKQEKKVFSEEEFIKRKAELDQKLLEDKIEYQEYEIELDELHNDVKTEALEQWYEKQLKGLGDNEQAKLELKIKYEKKKGKLVEKRNKFEEFMDSEHLKGARSASGQLVALKDSENKEMAAIGKAAAIFNITVDTASGAIAAYRSLAGIPFVGPALGAAAAAAVVAFGAEQIAKATSTSFAVGAAEIPQDLTATVHAGEMIVPATFAESIRAGELTLSGAEATTGAGAVSENIININFEGANFFGDINDEMLIDIGDRLGELINESFLSPLPIKAGI